jgi:DNA-binding NtrC family response regulator
MPIHRSNAEESEPLTRTSRGAIVGQHAALAQQLSIATRVAPSTCTVLVTGESGTGKELFVAALHDASPRRQRPLVAVNCGAIPAELVESELFGHARGAFTGAVSAKQGFVASAEGGTLFLDEVGELPLPVQVKLLRLLQSREYTPVGEVRPIACDIRIVAATNRDLEAEVAAGRFREDLYYRLDVVRLHLPALRERRDDIPLLAAHFLGVSARRAGREDVTGFSDEAMALLTGDDWQGNVRALENVVERAVLLTRSPEIRPSSLPPRFRARGADDAAPSAVPRPPRLPRLDGPPVTARPTAIPDAGIDLRAAVEAYENALIRDALTRTGYNKNRAAQLLRINRTTLVEMVKRKRLEPTGT